MKGRADRYRLAVVVSHPIQYFSPLYRRLAEQNDIDLTVFYCSRGPLDSAFDPGFGKAVSWDVPLLDGHKHVFLRNAQSRLAGGFLSLVNPSVIGELSRGRFDAVWLHGHNSVTHILAYLTAKVTRTAILMRGETHLGLQRSAVKRAIRRPLMTALYRGCTAALAIGSANRDFYRFHGVPDERIFDVPYAVDNHFFESLSVDARKNRLALRQRYNIAPADKVVLFASKFITRKRPMDLIIAFEKMATDRKVLLMVGSGELESQLASYVRERALDNVHFLGFKNQTELPAVYSMADVFVLPSENEPWGLIINEVMNASLPVVAARGIGAAVDLVRDGVNGYTYPVGDVDALAKCLDEVLKDPDLAQTMGANSRRLIGGWGLDQCVDGVRSALRYCRDRRRGAE
jgi:glycosyltransferase involved in cell wall biosynthesis